MNKMTLKLFGLIFLFLGLVFFYSFKQKGPVKPNIIFLLADDLRYNALGCMGNTIVKTPAIDQLAYGGTLFTNAYVTTPICSVSRASILSGQFANRHGINDFSTNFTDSARANNYPEVLRRNGYYTGFIGKYGVSMKMPVEDFDYWKGFEGQGVYFYKDKNGKQIHSSDLMANQALEFLNTRDKSKPFCLSVSFKAPHVQDGSSIHNGYIYSPLYENDYSKVTIPYVSNADDKYYLSFPETFRENAKGVKNEARVRWDLRFSTPEKYQESVKSYYRLITGMDAAVKQIVDELKKKGLEKNTIIIFSSDNGYSMGDHGLEGKWYAHDVSLRSMTIVYDGRNPQDKHSNRDLVLNVDIAPTILDYAGVKIPIVMQGQSLKPLVEGKKIDWRQDFYYSHLLETEVEKSRVYIPKSEGIIAKDYKYARYYNGNNPDQYFYEELFDRNTDPLEIDNLSNNAKTAVLKSAMVVKMRKYRESLK
jgi:arylsulfatase A-like enzyme